MDLQEVLEQQLEKLENLQVEPDHEPQLPHKLLDEEAYLDILCLDREYRKGTENYRCADCGATWYPHAITETVCPSCGHSNLVFGKTITKFQLDKTPKAQIPVLNNRGKEKGVLDITMLYSNTPNAHSQGRTRDWVVAYVRYPQEGYRTKHTYTVITGKSEGKLIRHIAGTINPLEKQTALSFTEDLGDEAAPQEEPEPLIRVNLSEEVYAAVQETLERLSQQLPVTREEAEELRTALGYSLQEE
jgi:DNA-directed RNA polymerase subunit RPC12/RpoP